MDAANFGTLNRAVIEQLPISMAVFDIQMRYVAYSRAWVEHYNLDESVSLIGRSHYEVFPEMPDAWKALHRRALEGETLHGEAERFERIDGSVQYGDWELRPWRDDAGNIAGMIAVTKDVTEAVRTRDQLRQSEMRWHFALEGSGDGLWDWNLVTNEVYFSPQWKAMLGFEEDEIEGSIEAWSSRVHPRQLEAVYADIRAYLEGRTEIYRNEHQVRCKDGSYKWVLDRGVVVERDDDGAALRMIGTHTDIDESKRLYERVAQMNERFESMFRDHDAIMYILDPSTGNILDANRSAERFYGYTHDEFVGLDVSRINTLPPAQIRERMAEAMRNSRNAFIFDHRLKNGELRKMEIHASPIAFDEGTVLFSILKDVTQEQAYEARLTRTLEQLNQAKKIVGLGIWEYNLLEETLEWSEEIYQICELDSRYFTPTYASFFERVHPEDRDAVDAAYRHSLEHRERYEITHRLMMDDGRVKYVQEQGDTQFDETGRPLRSIGTILDVTEAQQLSVAMRREKERYEQLMQYSSDGIAILDMQGRVVEVNRAFSRMLGYPPEECAGMSVLDWDAAHDEAKISELVEAVLKGPIDIETVHRRKDGSTYDAAVTAVVISIGDERFVYTATRDITERKHAEAKFKKLLELASDGIHILDQEGRTVYWSRSFARMLGYAYDEVASLSVFDWDDSIPRDELLPTIRALIDAPRIFESRHRRKDGNFYDAQINAKGIELDGQQYLYASVRDITREKKLQQEIVTERNFVSTIVDTANAIIAVIRPDGTMSRVNRYAEEFTGYSREEIASEPYFWVRFIHEELREKVSGIIANAKQGKVVTSFQNGWRSKSGEERMFEWSNTLVKRDDGSMDYLFTIGLDITDKVEAQRQIVQQKEEFETIFKTARDGLAILDMESNFVKFNDAYVEMTGYSHEELGYQSCIGMSVPEDIPRTQAMMQEVKTKGFVTNFEKSCYRRDGSLLSINMSIALLPDGEHMLISSKDVTEERRIRQELLHSKQTAESLLREQQSLLSLFDKGDSVLFKWCYDEHWSIDYVSDNVERLMGYSKAAFLNAEVLYMSCVHDKDAARIEREVHDAVDEGVDFFKHEPYRIRTASGKIKWVLDHTVIQRDTEGNITHFIGYLSEITELKKSQEALRNAKRIAEKANRAKSDFLANMSHEIRTPLNGIIGMTDVVLRGELEPQQRDYLTKARQSSHALLNIINDILDYSKIEAGKLDIVPTIFSLSTLTNNIASLFGYKVQEKGLDFGFAIDAAVPDGLVGDSLRIAQVLTNLVGNAVKFTMEGHVHVNVSVASSVDKSVVLRFEVNDSGIGISKTNRKKLFQPFEQGDQSTTKRFGGSGLGLMISRQLVELMGGEMGLHSEEGVGSTFWFTLPLYASDGRATAEPVALPEASQPFMVLREPRLALLVEDNETNQLVAQLLLEEMGFEVDIASNGRIGVDMCRGGGYDIVFMDIQMPVMDGFEASRTIREFNGEVPIVALSAAVMEKDKELSLSAGMNAHIAKPLNLAELSATIGRYFELVEQARTQPGVADIIEIEGADVAGLVGFVRKEPIHVYRMYDQFREHYKDTFDQLDLPPDSEAFRGYVHKLKGVSGNLRLHDVFELAKAVERGESPSSALKTALRNACEAIETHMTPYLHRSPPRSRDDWRALFEELRESIRESRFIPFETIEAFTGSIRDCVDPGACDELLQAYHAFDYEALEAQMTKIKERLDEC